MDDGMKNDGVRRSFGSSSKLPVLSARLSALSSRQAQHSVRRNLPSGSSSSPTAALVSLSTVSQRARATLLTFASALAQRTSHMLGVSVQSDVFGAVVLFLIVFLILGMGLLVYHVASQHKNKEPAKPLTRAPSRQGSRLQASPQGSRMAVPPTDSFHDVVVNSSRSSNYAMQSSKTMRSQNPRNMGGRSTASSIDTNYLCPDLVVPEGTECVLAVPVVAGVRGAPEGSARPIAISDKHGKTLLQVVIDRVSQRRGGMQLEERIALKSARGNTTLAYCEMSRQEAGGHNMCLVFKEDGDLFAKLDCDGTRKTDEHMDTLEHFELSSAVGGWHLDFYGNMADKNLNVTNEDSQLLATAEAADFSFAHPGTAYQLRVAPLADAGLILCVMMALDWVQAAGYSR